MKQTRVETYQGTKSYEGAVRRMNAQGWRQVSSTVTQPKTGCLRFVMLGGIGALVFKPKQHITVTWERDA